MTGDHDDLLPLMRTRRRRPSRKAAIHCNTMPLIPSPANLTSSLWCGTVLKAFGKSRKFASTLSPCSIASKGPQVAVYYMSVLARSHAEDLTVGCFLSYASSFRFSPTSPSSCLLQKSESRGCNFIASVSGPS